MPAIITISFLQARDLPVMDRASLSTDAYVDLYWGKKEIYKSQTRRKSLNPSWDETVSDYPLSLEAHFHVTFFFAV